MAKGRKVIETDGAFRLREEMASSVAVSVSKKETTYSQETLSLDINH